MSAPEINSALSIRQRAEAIVDSMPKNPQALSPEAMQELFHELQVHQLELEMQNEELRRTQTELETSRARYFELYDLAPVGYVSLNMAGMIVEANLTLANLLGRTRAEMAQRPFSKFIFPPDQNGYYLYRQKLITGETSPVCELRLKGANNAPFWAEIHGLITSDANGNSIFRAAISNITERKQIAAELCESHTRLEETLDQLRVAQSQLVRQERLAAVGQLAAGIAHDFNNILAVISIYIEMSLTTPDLPSQLQNQLATIYKQTELAAHLVQQILDFGRRAMLKTKPLDLALLLQDWVELWRSTIPKSISIHYASQIDQCLIEADPSRLQQLFTNLALNARDAMPDGGELLVNLKHLQLATLDEAPLPDMLDLNYAQITVSDTGTGISELALAHIYEPFFTTKEPGKGSGLGLAQVYGIVKQHKGHIDVRTESGQGTAFTIYLPVLSIPTAIATAVTQSDPIFGHGEKILVVEDNDLLREGLAAALVMLNYQPITAANGQKALAILNQHGADMPGSDQPIQSAVVGNIALLLCDLAMPKMGGKKLLHTMRRQGLPTPVVMMSGNFLGVDKQALQNLGVVGWLAKPPNLQDLAAAIALALQIRPIDG